jgi:predicted ATPase
MNESNSTPAWYVLTGGPCAGKTSTIDELAKRGYPVLAEAARLLIDQRLAAGKTIQEIVTDPDWLPSVVRQSYGQEREVSPSETWFFDRATPDSIAYYGMAQRPFDPELTEALRAIRYRKVFLLDLVEYETDHARSETPEQARSLHEEIRAAYAGQGYDVVPVPVMPIQERVQYILARL